MKMARKEQADLIVIRGVIAGMPEDDQQKIKAAAEDLRATMDKHGDHGIAGLALLGAEIAAEAP